MESVYKTLTDRALNIHKRLNAQGNPPSRVIIALAGVPGAGKSTVAAEVVRRLNLGIETPYAAVLPMDGFHFSRAILDQLPNCKEAYLRRGAAWTFDAQGVVDLITALHQSRLEPALRTQTYFAPSFDHEKKDPVPNALCITTEISLIIVEGNWLLLDEEPWNKISCLVDDTWFIDVAPELARMRIARRHVESGIEEIMEDAYRRVESNDLPNGQLIREKLIPPAVCVESVEMR